MIVSAQNNRLRVNKEIKGTKYLYVVLFNRSIVGCYENLNVWSLYRHSEMTANSKLGSYQGRSQVFIGGGGQDGAMSNLSIKLYCKILTRKNFYYKFFNLKIFQIF